MHLCDSSYIFYTHTSSTLIYTHLHSTSHSTSHVQHTNVYFEFGTPNTTTLATQPFSQLSLSNTKLIRHQARHISLHQHQHQHTKTKKPVSIPTTHKNYTKVLFKVYALFDYYTKRLLYQAYKDRQRYHTTPKLTNPKMPF